MGGFRLKVLCLKLELEMWKATYRIWMCAPSGNLRVSLQVKSMLLRAMSIPAQDFAIVPAYATQGRRTNEHRGHESSIGTCPRHGSPVCIALARRRRSTSEGASKRPFPVHCEYGITLTSVKCAWFDDKDAVMLQRTGRWRNGQSGGLGTASLFEASRCAMIANKGSYLDFNFLVLLASILQRAGCLLSMRQDVVGPAPSPPLLDPPILPPDRQDLDPEHRRSRTSTLADDATQHRKGRRKRHSDQIRHELQCRTSPSVASLTALRSTSNGSTRRTDRRAERIRCEPHAVGGLVW